MEKFILLIATAVLFSITHAQQLEGKIVFERTTKFQFQIANEDPALQNMMPKERKDKFECLFANNQSIWRASEDEPDAGDIVVNNGSAEIRMIMPGSNDVIFNDIAKQTKVEQRELFTRTFIVQDSIRKMSWKIGEETKTILGMKCRQATGTRTQTSYRVSMDNGNMDRKQVIDTLRVVAWFTDEIAGFYGPDQYQGQLPGTILELVINDGNTVYLATEMIKKVDKNLIKEPKGKKITPEEFAMERDKMMKEMDDNGGGNIRMRRL